MIDRMLRWLDLHVLHCRWHWLCDLVWDRQLALDAKMGALDRLFTRSREDQT